MTEDTTFKISIPPDNDGYILLHCSWCGECFKITVKEFDDEGNLNLYCPSCGLVSDSYLTEDVIELAQAMVNNYAMDMLYNSFKDIEKMTKHNNFISFKAGKRPEHENENPIKVGVEAFEMAEFDCCNKMAKIKPLLRITGCYCPFCGVKNYEVK